MMIVDKAYTDCDQFLESLKNIDSESVNVLIQSRRAWIGYLEKGSIIIQEFKTLKELLTMFLGWKKFRGKKYTVFIEAMLSDFDRKNKADYDPLIWEDERILGTVMDDPFLQFLYTEKKK